MVHTRTSKDPILDIPKDLSNMDVAKPHVAMLHLHHLARQLAWNNYWQRRMTS
jgi:hypothetical protein